jgi:hypothetical protein
MRAHPLLTPAANDLYHAIRFCDSERSLARMVAEFLIEGFDAGSPAIVIATTSQRTAIVRELTLRSVDVVALRRSHDLLMLDAERMLSMFMMNDRPDAAAFKETMSRTVAHVSRGRSDCTVRIFGQVIDVLWRQDQRDAAIRLEVLWNQFATSDGSSLLYGYVIGHFYKECRRHPHSGWPQPAGEHQR